MKPKLRTAAIERREDKELQCDQIIYRAAQIMVEKNGASIDMMLDRMLTYAAAQACSIDGSPKTAATFRLLADRIESGVFHSLTGENVDRGDLH